MSVSFHGSNHNETRTVMINGEAHTYFAPVHLHEVDIEADFRDPRSMYLCNDNAVAFLGLLGLHSEDLCGEASVPDVRRAIMRARATFMVRVGQYTREEDRDYGAPRRNQDGTIELRPLRVHTFGLDEDQLHDYLDRLSVLVEALTMNDATHIAWS